MKPRLLIDLKPALDGYAGIPQETRLLFNALNQLPDIEADGLIQHGGKQIRANKKPNAPDSAFRDAKTVISFKSDKRSHLTTAKMALGLSMSPTQFNTTHYKDFIWSTLFSKSLSSKDRQRITKARYYIVEHSKNAAYKTGIYSHKYGLGRRFPNINTTPWDLFIAQTPYPAKLPRRTKLIVRYHDAVPLLMPDTIKDRWFHLSSHYQAIKSNIERGAWFSCVSEASRQDLIRFFPETADKSTVIYNMISDSYYVEASNSVHVNEIVRTRLAHSIKKLVLDENEAPEYLLIVSTIEPRKNHQLLIDAWEQLRIMGHSNLKLIIVGNPGWDQEDLLKSIHKQQQSGNILHLQDVPAHELRILYRHAAATICPSLMEGFDYSGIESMKSGGYVAASDIPVHREVFAEAALYFDPYSAESAAQAIDQLLNGNAAKTKEQLKHAKEQLLPRYETKKLVKEWSRFIQKILNSDRAS